MPSGINPRFSKVGKRDKNQVKTPQTAFIIYQWLCISGVGWLMLTRDTPQNAYTYKHAGTLSHRLPRPAQLLYDS